MPAVSSSQWPTGDDSHDATRLQLKDDFQSASRDCSTDELKPIAIGLVPSDFIIREETLNRFFKRDPVHRELITLEVILKVSRRKPMPINHAVILTSQCVGGKNTLMPHRLDSSYVRGLQVKAKEIRCSGGSVIAHNL